MTQHIKQAMAMVVSQMLSLLFALASAQNTTYTQLETTVETITSCAPTVTDCPARKANGTAYVTHTNTLTVVVCPTGNTTLTPSTASSTSVVESTTPSSAVESANGAAVVGAGIAAVAGALLL